MQRLSAAAAAVQLYDAKAIKKGAVVLSPSISSKQQAKSPSPDSLTSA
jgi:hypothetical protein